MFTEKILKPSAVELANTEKVKNSPNLKNYFDLSSSGLGAQIELSGENGNATMLLMSLSIEIV